MMKEVEQMTDLTFGNQGWLVRVRQNRSWHSRVFDPISDFLPQANTNKDTNPISKFEKSQTSHPQQIQTKIQIQSQNLSQMQK